MLWPLALTSCMWWSSEPPTTLGRDQEWRCRGPDGSGGGSGWHDDVGCSDLCSSAPCQPGAALGGDNSSLEVVSLGWRGGWLNGRKFQLAKKMLVLGCEMSHPIWRVSSEYIVCHPKNYSYWKGNW